MVVSLSLQKYPFMDWRKRTIPAASVSRIDLSCFPENMQVYKIVPLLLVMEKFSDQELSIGS
jgi:hypothetical protein